MAREEKYTVSCPSCVEDLPADVANLDSDEDGRLVAWTELECPHCGECISAARKVCVHWV